MIEDVRRDPIIAFLLRNSSITEAQLDTIMAAQIDGNLDVKTSSREKRKVSKGSFVRTLRQGQGNVESSVYTLMMLVYLKLVSQERVDQFARTLRLISRVKEAEPDEQSVQKLILGMEEFASDFSGRGRRKVIL